MIVMMIVMFLPVLAIAVFWFLSPGAAIPIYLFCLLLSGSLYWLMHNNMKRPVTTGTESLIGKETMVISQSTSDEPTPYMVRMEGEIWCASSPDSLKTGDTVVIVAVKGNKLTIERKDKNMEEG
jgi:membrane protein implicated in regulation of membrane protease activity